MARPTREQFERMVHEHHAAVHRAAMRLCADDAAAADVAQDVFVRVLQGKERLERAHSERATLCWLATRLAANACRAARRRHDHEENAMRDHRNDLSTDPDPAAQTMRADLHRAVQEHVGELPADLRVPLLLHCEDELTLAAIGTALRLPTSTVHDRVEKALQRLRASLARRGHAVAAPALPGLLAGVQAPPTPGLEARLLALGGKVVPAAASVARRLAFAGVVVVGAGAAWLAAQPSGGVAGPISPATGAVVSAPTIEAPEQDPQRARPTERVAATPPVPPLPGAGGEQGAVRDLATFTGTVHDAEAWPVAGATVLVVAGGGYKPFALGGEATTDARGAFTVTARSSWLDPRAVRLIVRENGRELLQTGDLALPRAADAPPLALVLPAAVGSAPSKYELEVTVLDDAGRALADVPVALLGASEPAPVPDQVARESQAKTGADGRARLAGRGLGAKWLFVDGRPLHRQSSFARVAIAAAGPHQRDVTLAAGGEWTVRVTTVSGRALEWSQPWIADESTGLQLTGEPQADGALRFRGLGSGPFTVHAHGDNRTSPATLRGVRPGAEPLTVRLKERSDEHDVGDHDAEVHGELVDAATGEVVPYEAFAIEVKPLLFEGSTLASDGAEPPAPAQRMAERGTWKRFHLTGLGAGKWLVTGSVRGYAMGREVVTLGEREVKTGVRVLLQKQAVVRGTVTGPDGQPLAGATVFALGVGPLADAQIEAWREWRTSERDPGAREPSWIPLRGWTRKGGTFVVDNVPPGVPLRLVARHDEHGLVVVPLPSLQPGETLEHFDVRLPGR